jgi:hypothetical protein
MGHAEELWKAFLAQHPEAVTGKVTLDELNRKLADFNQKRNQTPHPDFESLSPEQMHHLLHAPLSSDSVIGLKGSYEEPVLDKIPFFILMERLWEELQTSQILKLTPKGNLSIEICKRLYEAKVLVQEDIERGITKKISEDNVAFIRALKICLQLGGYVKKRKNTLSLAKAAEKGLQLERSKQFVKLFTDFTTRFNWAYLDYVENTTAGQFAWAFSLLLLHKYGGEWKECSFYANKLLKAFPMISPSIPHPMYATMEIEYERVYQWRFVEHFAFWFGLVELEQRKEQGIYGYKLFLRRSDLFDKIFHVRFHS